MGRNAAYEGELRFTFRKPVVRCLVVSDKPVDRSTCITVLHKLQDQPARTYYLVQSDESISTRIPDYPCNEMAAFNATGYTWNTPDDSMELLLACLIENSRLWHRQQGDERRLLIRSLTLQLPVEAHSQFQACVTSRKDVLHEWVYREKISGRVVMQLQAYGIEATRQF